MRYTTAEVSIVIQISENRRFLCDPNGEPFFYLADTAWEMLHRLSFEETRFYLQNRVDKGFTAIQTVILAEENGLRDPTPAGEIPLHDLDPTRPNEAYFAHVDRVLELARELGLVLALLPTWGDKWNLKWGGGPVIFTPQNAFIYGQFLGSRYKNAPNLIWVLGGDRTFDTPEQREIIEQMALGIEAGGARQLKTLHPTGGRGSSQDFPDAPWLDFHMWQSGHGRNTPNYAHIAADYARENVKPVLDGEPGYEDHKAGFALENGFLDDYDNRKALYWALFSGACGHTYGCHPVWQMADKHRRPVNHPRRFWHEALDLPGASQIGFARVLHEKWAFLGEEPAPEMVVAQRQNEAGEEMISRHVAAIRARDGAWALLYFTCDDKVEINLESLRGETVRFSWFDPRRGAILEGGAVAKTSAHAFPVPGWGPDWVLILESE